jgi:hypothetical protein
MAYLWDPIDLDTAKQIVAKVTPRHNAEFSCMLVASAIAGSMGLTMRHIRVGSLFWPDKFKDDPMLSMRGGWGCEGFSAADGKLYLSDTHIDMEDGGFNGHTWIETSPDEVIDPMHDNYGSLREIYSAEFRIVGRYIPRPPLERAVKGFWRAEMTQAMKLGKEHATALAAAACSPEISSPAMRP